MGRKIAFVTGASRGIGRECAIALAKKGFDVGIAARTVKQGEKHEHGLEKEIALPGSLHETRDLVAKYGVRVKLVQMDFSDEAACVSALNEFLREWGHIDVFVNSGIYKGKADLQLLCDLDLDEYRKMIQCNLLTPVALLKVLLGQKSSEIRLSIFMLSTSSINLKPRFPVNRGGWDFAYVSSKSAISKLAGIVSVEYPSEHVNCFNIEPGLVKTELMKQRGLDDNYTSGFGDIPPQVTGEVVAFLATQPNDSEIITKMNGKSVYAPKLCEDLQLLPNYTENKPKSSKSKL